MQQLVIDVGGSNVREIEPDRLPNNEGDSVDTGEEQVSDKEESETHAAVNIVYFDVIVFATKLPEREPRVWILMNG